MTTECFAESVSFSNVLSINTDKMHVFPISNGDCWGKYFPNTEQPCQTNNYLQQLSKLYARRLELNLCEVFGHVSLLSSTQTEIQMTSQMPFRHFHTVSSIFTPLISLPPNHSFISSYLCFAVFFIRRLFKLNNYSKRGEMRRKSILSIKQKSTFPLFVLSAKINEGGRYFYYYKYKYYAVKLNFVHLSINIFSTQVA